MLNKIEDYNELKEKFANKFFSILKQNINFREFLYEIFLQGETAYVVGGFLRDIILNKHSRDLDIMVSLPLEKVLEIIKLSNLDFLPNRFNGFKISLIDIEVDLWCVEDNWAFKNELVVKNDENILESIANGSFYNYDSLVINVHTNNLIIKNFNHFLETKHLDIIQSNKDYKKLNPSIEANILRAFYLRVLYEIDYTENCNSYLLARIGFLNDKYSSAINRLLDFKKKYIKYDSILNKENILDCIKYCNTNFPQKSIDF